MAVTEQQLAGWAKPVSTSEDEKCKNAVSQVTTAVRNTFGYSVTIFLQGSYENNTNVRQDSDVDIVVRHDGYFFPDLQRLDDVQKSVYHQNHPNSTYTFAQFKNEVQASLNTAFTGVQRKNKCILVPGNTYRVNADVVPCFQLKRFTNTFGIEAEGIKFNSDDGYGIDSYPQQHYTNGVIKTNTTNRMYKRTVRILKRMRNELIDANLITDKLASSFFIECLVYNVPNSNFISGYYLSTLRNVIIKLYNDMESVAITNEYKEVSELKWLFRNTDRSPSDAKLFMQKCWEYAGFQQ